MTKINLKAPADQSLDAFAAFINHAAAISGKPTAETMTVGEVRRLRDEFWAGYSDAAESGADSFAFDTLAETFYSSSQARARDGKWTSGRGGGGGGGGGGGDASAESGAEKPKKRTAPMVIQHTGVEHYEFTHGTKPRGYGNWQFEVKVDGVKADYPLNHVGLFTEAKTAVARRVREVWYDGKFAEIKVLT